MTDISQIIDWTSMKLTAAAVLLTIITWTQFMGLLSGIAVISTIIYNAIRIYKELKNKKDKQAPKKKKDE